MMCLVEGYSDFKFYGFTTNKTVVNFGKDFNSEVLQNNILLRYDKYRMSTATLLYDQVNNFESVIHKWGVLLVDYQ